jgi:hypothetical protein
VFCSLPQATAIASLVVMKIKLGGLLAKYTITIFRFHLIDKFLSSSLSDVVEPKNITGLPPVKKLQTSNPVNISIQFS